MPVPHLRMLSLGLDHLLKGVEEHSGTLEKRGQQGAQEVEQATKRLEELSKQSLQTGRTHRQVGSKQSGRIVFFVPWSMSCRLLLPSSSFIWSHFRKCEASFSAQ